MADLIDKKNLAILIDAENISPSYLEVIMEEATKSGRPTIKRIYGNFADSAVAPWKEKLLLHGFIPVQQYSYTQRKNSSDSAMIIDAMDILFENKVEGFVIVSSDSDFTRLCLRLKESGKYVIGIGETKAPTPFKGACDVFVYLEILLEAKHRREKKTVTPARTPAAEKRAEPPKTDVPADAVYRPQPIQESKSRRVPDDVIDMIANAIAVLGGDADNDWVFLGELGNYLRRKNPDFDCRSYGFEKISSMMKSISRFETVFRDTSDPAIKHPYVRDREAPGIEELF
ncbi:MAG: NYN domain-containing protein [Oscillospiraceae bacterium]|nr:NYN domain-containing protein [Oscillospiraceae bacterium]